MTLEQRSYTEIANQLPRAGVLVPDNDARYYRGVEDIHRYLARPYEGTVLVAETSLSNLQEKIVQDTGAALPYELLYQLDLTADNIGWTILTLPQSTQALRELVAVAHAKEDGSLLQGTELLDEAAGTVLLSYHRNMNDGGKTFLSDIMVGGVILDNTGTPRTLGVTYQGHGKFGAYRLGVSYDPDDENRRFDDNMFTKNLSVNTAKDAHAQPGIITPAMLRAAQGNQQRYVEGYDAVAGEKRGDRLCLTHGRYSNRWLLNMRSHDVAIGIRDKWHVTIPRSLDTKYGNISS